MLAKQHKVKCKKMWSVIKPWILCHQRSKRECGWSSVWSNTGDSASRSDLASRSSDMMSFSEMSGSRQKEAISSGKTSGWAASGGNKSRNAKLPMTQRTAMVNFKSHWQGTTFWWWQGRLQRIFTLMFNPHSFGRAPTLEAISYVQETPVGSTSQWPARESQLGVREL